MSVIAMALQSRLSKLPAEFLSAVVDALPVGALIMDPEWQILAANHAAELFLGFSEAELQKLPVDELVPLELRERYRSARNAAMGSPDTRGVLLREERM